MCLLNGDLGGALTASIDFGTEEYLDKISNTTTYTKVPIDKIIREALHTYALEPYHNIVINDLDETAVELLEYRGDTPLYLLHNVELDEFDNYTDNGSAKVYFTHETINEAFPIEELEERGGYYDSRVELAPEAQANKASQLYFVGAPNVKYTVAKLEYGQTAGYRKTELTYAGELISNVGEALTSILDKIKNMLGNYEYFYDIDGRFIFQRKKTYISNSWNNILKAGEEQYANNAAHSSSVIYRFEGNRLVTAFQNTPQLNNLKNDYSIWGSRTSVSGEKIPIHYRYAIDIKPSKYTSLTITEDDLQGYEDLNLKPQNSVEYTIEDFDWRELIYQMALDYYKYNQLDCYSTRLAEANKGKHGEESLYQNGYTGYEQYYTDLQGFWRQLYNIAPEPTYLDFPNKGKEDVFEYMNHEGNTLDLYIKGYYEPITLPTTLHHSDVFALIDVNGKDELHPWLEAIQIPEYDDQTEYNEVIGDETNIAEDFTSKWFYIKGPKEYQPVYWSVRNQYSKQEIYVLENGEYMPLVKSSIYNMRGIKGLYCFNDDKGYHSILNLPYLKHLYYNNLVYNKFLYTTPLYITGLPILNAEKNKQTIKYYTKQYDYIIDKNDEHLYWTTQLITNPSQLNFWFDFLDGTSELGQFAVPVVGNRAKAVNEDSVTAIYFREVPNLIFTTYQNYIQSGMKDDSGYTPVFINGNLESMFTISAQGKSAQDKLNELLYNHSYCIESISLSTIPVYYLQPNTRIFVRDDTSNVNGEYIVSKITIPLQYNGVMSITATKAPERLY